MELRDQEEKGKFLYEMKNLFIFQAKFGLHSSCLHLSWLYGVGSGWQ